MTPWPYQSVAVRCDVREVTDVVLLRRIRVMNYL